MKPKCAEAVIYLDGIHLPKARVGHVLGALHWVKYGWPSVLTGTIGSLAVQRVKQQPNGIVKAGGFVRGRSCQSSSGMKFVRIRQLGGQRSSFINRGNSVQI
eukprot:scaffold264090_cov29-Prasinocladus_malaysianus.AAC.1